MVQLAKSRESVLQEWESIPRFAGEYRAQYPNDKSHFLKLETFQSLLDEEMTWSLKRVIKMQKVMQSASGLEAERWSKSEDKMRGEHGVNINSEHAV